jgi:UDP-glucose 4-epimerase
MARILLTGGAGYVGSVCCAELMAQGHSVTVLDDLSTGHKDAIPKATQFCQGDISSPEVASLLHGNRFDAVFHFAAKALIPESIINPGFFFDVNVASTIRLLEMLRNAGVSRFVFSSSAAVYGIPSFVPITEDHPTDPINAYGATKLMIEQALRWYASAYGWSVVAFRYFNAAGSAYGVTEKHVPETHIIPLLLETALGQRPWFEIYGDNYPTPDGTCLRDYVHVRDIAQAHIAALTALEEPGFRVYNIGNGSSYSVLQVCQAVERITGLKLRSQTSARRPGDPPILCADPSALRRDLHWEPLISSLDDIIGTAWEAKRGHLTRIADTSVVARLC